MLVSLLLFFFFIFILYKTFSKNLHILIIFDLLLYLFRIPFAVGTNIAVSLCLCPFEGILVPTLGYPNFIQRIIKRIKKFQRRDTPFLRARKDKIFCPFLSLLVPTLGYPLLKQVKKESFYAQEKIKYCVSSKSQHRDTQILSKE